MDLERVCELGESVRNDYRGVDFDESKFPEIAEKALARVSDWPAFDITVAANFLAETDYEQRPSQGSDLPLVLYRCQSFYIELLVWMQTVPTVHQHKCAGAFRVLEGGSIHSLYDFDIEQRLGSRLMRGRVALRKLEELRPGDIRRITPGSSFCHGLYHLHEPSVTMVIRTHTLLWATPQYNLLEPWFAFDQKLLRDPTIVLMRRAMQVACRADPAAAAQIVVESLPRLDLPRKLIALLQNLETVRHPEVWEQIVEILMYRHGELGEKIVAVLDVASTKEKILKARVHTTEPDLRFFLAVLLNVPSRPQALEYISRKFPQEDASMMCAKWIHALAQEKPSLSTILSLSGRANFGPHGLSSSLAAAIDPQLDDQQQVQVLRCFIAGMDEETMIAEVQRTLGTDVPERRRAELLQAYARVGQVPELARLAGS